MKNFRTILLIAGILVAGLALNTAFAQTTEEVSDKKEIKAEEKVKPKEKRKDLALEVKEQRKREVKSESKVRKKMYKDQKVRNNEQKVKPRKHQVA